MLGGVVGVDTDVFVGQIRGPELAGAGSLVKIDADGELGLLDVGVGRGFVEVDCATAIAADREVAEGDVDALGVDLRAGVADGCHQASPVRIATGPRRFDEWRVRDRFGYAHGLGVGCCAMNVKFDYVGHAFAIGDYLSSERRADLAESGGELATACTDTRAAGPGREE